MLTPLIHVAAQLRRRRRACAVITHSRCREERQKKKDAGLLLLFQGLMRFQRCRTMFKREKRNACSLVMQQRLISIIHILMLVEELQYVVTRCKHCRLKRKGLRVFFFCLFVCLRGVSCNYILSELKTESRAALSGSVLFNAALWVSHNCPYYKSHFNICVTHPEGVKF